MNFLSNEELAEGWASATFIRAANLTNEPLQISWAVKVLCAVALNRVESCIAAKRVWDFIKLVRFCADWRAVVSVCESGISYGKDLKTHRCRRANKPAN